MGLLRVLGVYAVLGLGLRTRRDARVQQHRAAGNKWDRQLVWGHSTLRWALVKGRALFVMTAQGKWISWDRSICVKGLVRVAHPTDV